MEKDRLADASFTICEVLHKDIANLYESLADSEKSNSLSIIEKIETQLSAIKNKLNEI